MKKKLILAVMIVPALLLVVFFAPKISNIPDTANEALERFENQQVAEDQLQDPLILAGNDVVPLILSRVANKEYERRRYAVAALGNIGDPAAADVLAKIAVNKSEPSYLRCDALVSLYMVNKEEAFSIHASLDAGLECPFGILASIRNGEDLDDKQMYFKRTYWTALMGRHE